MARGEVDTSTPHDSLFKRTFKVPHRAAALFRAKLPKSLSAKIDWSTLEPIPGSFVNSRLAAFHTDLLFSVRMGTAVLLLYLLLEHQSTVVQDMPFRMLEYEVEIWRGYRQHTGDIKRLPPIIPVLISQAPGGWTAPLSLWEMMDPDPATIPELAPLVPNFQLVLEDLAHLSNEELRTLAIDAVAKLAMVMLRDARYAEAREANRAVWMQLARDVLRAPSGMEAMVMFLSYLAHVIERPHFQDFCDTMLRELPETEAAVRTYAEELLEKGREQGLEKGLEQGREQERRVSLRAFIVDMLEVRGFALTRAQRERIESCESLETLRRWYAAAKTAPGNETVDHLLDSE